MSTQNKFTVIVAGIEMCDKTLTFAQAIEYGHKFTELGFTDVHISND